MGTCLMVGFWETHCKPGKRIIDMITNYMCRSLAISHEKAGRDASLSSAKDIFFQSGNSHVRITEDNYHLHPNNKRDINHRGVFKIIITILYCLLAEKYGKVILNCWCSKCRFQHLLKIPNIETAENKLLF